MRPQQTHNTWPQTLNFEGIVCLLWHPSFSQGLKTSHVVHQTSTPCFHQAVKQVKLD